MKIRQGFVSNSSSSSFIIAVNKSKKSQEITINVPITIKLDECCDETFETEEELYKYYTEGNHMSDEELIEDEDYQKSLEAIKEGKVVLHLCFGTDGEAEEAMLCERGLKEGDIKDGIIIDGESRR